MQALKGQDRDAFLAAEGLQREAAGLPPYGRLAALIITSADPDILGRLLPRLGRRRPPMPGAGGLWPADAPLALVRGRRRKRFLVRADRGVDLQAFLNTWRARVKIPGAVRLTIDVDPYSFL